MKTNLPCCTAGSLEDKGPTIGSPRRTELHASRTNASPQSKPSNGRCKRLEFFVLIKASQSLAVRRLRRCAKERRSPAWDERPVCRGSSRQNRRRREHHLLD